MKTLLLIVASCLVSQASGQTNDAVNRGTKPDSIATPKYYTLPNKFNSKKTFYVPVKPDIKKTVTPERSFNIKTTNFPLSFQSKNYSLPYTTQVSQLHPISLPTPAQLVVKPEPVWKQALALGLNVYVDAKKSQSLHQ